jgi:hypothetical protein
MNCKHIYRIWHCLDLVFYALFSPFSFPSSYPFLTLDICIAEWIIIMTCCSFPSVRNWKYAAYRDTSHVPAVNDDTGKDNTAIRYGMTLDGDWWKATRRDFQRRWLQIVTYDTITEAVVGQKKTSESEKLLIKLSSRPTRKVYWSHLCFRPPAARLNTAKPCTLT